MKTTSTPHDAIFKQLLTQTETARDFLTIHLPPTLLQVCDLSTLKLENSSFVEEDLRAFYSDILYSMKTTDGDDSYIYALIEHQSTPDKNMAFRLMRYAIAAMQRHLDAGHKQLPLVIPFMFYQGEISPYPYSLRWLDSFANPELAQRLYTRAFPLADITVIEDDDIMQHRKIAVLEFLMKHIRRRDLKELVEPIAILLKAGYNDAIQVKALMQYMVQAGESADPEGLLKMLAFRVPQHEEAFMTIAETLIHKGRQEGRQEGLHLGEQKGRQEGEREAKLKMARDMLDNNIHPSMVMKIAGLTEDELKNFSH